MDWNNDLCLQLIEHYKEYRCLWDPSVGDYKNNSLKEDAWNAIGKIMKCRVDEVNKKMDSLLASYRRERQKSMLPKTGSGAESTYKSKWYAYTSMQFLLDKYKPRSTINTPLSNPNNTVELEPTQTAEEGFETQNTTNYDDNKLETKTISASSSHQKEFKSPQKKQEKRKFSEDPRVEDAYKCLKETISNRRDESSVFGEHVAMKHRKYSAYTKSTIEHLISNILYEADMGKYDDPTTSPSSSYFLPSPSPSSYSQPSPSGSSPQEQSSSQAQPRMQTNLTAEDYQPNLETRMDSQCTADENTLRLFINTFSEDITN